MRMTLCLFVISFLFSLTSWANDDDEGSYNSAFSSIRKEAPKDHEQEWNQSAQKQDSFDIENMTFEETAPAKPTKAASKSSYGGSRAPASASGEPEPVLIFDVETPSANSRAPASESKKNDKKAAKSNSKNSEGFQDNPLPKEGSDLDKELNSFGSDSGSAFPAVDDGGSAAGSASSAVERNALIKQTVSRKYSELKECYNQGVKAGDSEMRGRVVMAWEMDAKGNVKNAEVQSSDLNNKKVEKCMTDKFSRWNFTRAAVSSTKDRKTYTFSFVPED